MMRRKWQAWRRRQPSRIRYAMVPAPPRITAAGLKSQARLIELRVPAMFVLAVLALVLTGCGSTRTVTTTVTRTVGKAPCPGVEQMTRCALDVIRDLAVYGNRDANLVKGKCRAFGAQWKCTVQYPASDTWDGSTVCLEVVFDETSELRLPSWVDIVKAPEARCGAVLGST